MDATPATLEEVFLAAIELPGEKRAAFVERRCEGDPALLARVERLLAAHEKTATSFLDPPTASLRGPVLRPAAKLGRYAILYEMGRGGMGVVYAAYDEALQRKIAVKQVRGGTGIRSAAARLELEAKALARLQHPNVVAVHDVGSVDGQLFIAMELVDGLPLSKWAESRTPLEVLRALLAAGKGLAHAHREGILHRDFKPGNVLIDASGRARVADFGLAADADQVASDAAPMGTPGFMAPEIVSGRPASVASDIYAYCRSLEDLVLAHKGAPPWLEPLVKRGLLEAPGDRWEKLEDLLLAVEHELGVDPQNDPRLGRPQRRRAAVLVAAIVFAVPAVALVGRLSPVSLEDGFRLSLVPPLVLAVVTAVFWRPLTATAYNRRVVLAPLVMSIAIAVHRGLTLELSTSAPSAVCEDLLLLAAFLTGGMLYERDRLYVGSASVCALGAAAVALFPAQATPIFVGVTIALLPFGYAFASKGRATR
jgi:hypothetical protein